jgi:hypothetical protein
MPVMDSRADGFAGEKAIALAASRRWLGIC